MNKGKIFKIVTFGKYIVGLALVVDACMTIGQVGLAEGLVKNGYTVSDSDGNKIL